MQLRLGAAVLLVACGSLASCALLAPAPSGRSPLKPLRPSPETVSLEIFSARFAPDDRQVNETLWEEVDEQQIPIETRRLLAQHGLRAGVLGAHPPAALATLLKLAETPPAEPRRGERDASQLLEEPTVTMRSIFTRGGWRNEIIASKPYDELPLLERDGDQVRGRTYPKAEGRFALRAFPQPDGRVRLNIAPELQYGDAQQRWTSSDGVLRTTATRPKKTFGGLEIETTLAAGQMLLISCVPDRPGSVGHWFFMEPRDERLSQKLLVVRVAQATADSSFTEWPLAKRLEEIVSKPE